MATIYIIVGTPMPDVMEGDHIVIVREVKDDEDA